MQKNSDLKKGLQRLGSMKHRKPATINQDFDDAIDTMITKVLPDAPIDNSPQTEDRFNGVLAMMTKNKLGKSYKAVRVNLDWLELRKQGCARIMVVMPSIKSVPQWSVDGKPMRGMEDAIDNSRTMRKPKM